MGRKESLRNIPAEDLAGLMLPELLDLKEIVKFVLLRQGD